MDYQEKHLITKKGQIWIETVLYTMIGLALIALVLSYITPKVNEARNELLVEQSIQAMQNFNARIEEAISRGSGNILKIEEFTMTKGELFINVEKNNVTMLIKDLSSQYSEPGVQIPYGRVNVTTMKGPKSNSVYITTNFNSDIRFEGKNGAGDAKKFSASPTPYKFVIENKIDPTSGNTIIDIREVSRR